MPLGEVGSIALKQHLRPADESRRRHSLLHLHAPVGRSQLLNSDSWILNSAFEKKLRI
jgi:hypothetical protein